MYRVTFVACVTYVCKLFYYFYYYILFSCFLILFFIFISIFVYENNRVFTKYPYICQACQSGSILCIIDTLTAV